MSRNVVVVFYHIRYSRGILRSGKFSFLPENSAEYVSVVHCNVALVSVEYSVQFKYYSELQCSAVQCSVALISV